MENAMNLAEANVVAALRKEYDEWISGLTEKEKYAIEKYSWNSFDRLHKREPFFSRLNAMLRGISSTEGEMLEEYAELISNAISKHPIKHSVICYRGSDHDMTDYTPIGEMFESLQFISTSVIRSKKIKGRYEFIIHLPIGANAAYIEKLSAYKKQRELLINRNTYFKVISRNGTLIELEVVV
jgi:methionine synthase II (cobalamin-independent)